MSGDEHDLRVIALRDLALEIQSVDVRKFDVQHQASRDIGLRIRHVLGSGTERDRVHIEARKKLGQRFADPTVVVHDENDVVLSIHLCDSAAREGSQSATFDISVLECGCCELRRDTHI